MSSSSPAVILLRRCWTTLGLPFADEPFDEHREGLVDPEALFVATLLVPGALDARLGENIREWCGVFERVLHYQRLKSLIERLPEVHRDDVLGDIKRAGLHFGPRRLQLSLGILKTRTAKQAEQPSRRGRIRPPENTAALSIFIRQRMLFGTGYRADLVSLTSIRRHVFGGSELARLLATSPSTVSRILTDLKACGFLDQRGRQRAPGVDSPQLIVSADSLANIACLLDASRIEDPALARAIEDECDFEWDRLGAALMGRKSESNFSVSTGAKSRRRREGQHCL